MARAAGTLCPTCRRPLPGADKPDDLPFRPFCSERCRTIDLGSWLDASYRIGAPVEEEDLDQGMPTEGEPEPKRPIN
jgi:endogenous inhibitor of DNA gyrase (YacG/DUF329 family)